MSYSLDDALQGVRSSRRWFLRHLRGLRDEQWDWKPYAECKNIRETVAHLIVDDLAAIQSIETRAEPEYEALSQQNSDAGDQEAELLLKRLSDTHEQLIGMIVERYAGKPIDAEICIFGDMKKLAAGVAYLSAEDFYHAGQVGFIRMATDPSWDYYTAVYGPE